MKLSKEHFELFKKECNMWINKFGLIGWEVHYTFSNKLGKDAAHCRTIYTARVATLSLSSEIPNDSPYLDNINLNIKRSAFHEVMELFLSPLLACAGDRNWDEEIWDRESHAVIMTLQNIFINK